MLENVSCALCASRRLKRFTKVWPFYWTLWAVRFCLCQPALTWNRKYGNATIRLFLAGISSFIGCAGRKYNLELFDARHAAMLNLIASYIQPPGKLLEVGAGAGFFLKAAERCRLGCGRDWSIWSRCSICTNWVGFGCKTTSSWKITWRLFWCSSYDVVNTYLIKSCP